MLKLKRYPSRSPYWYVRGTVAGCQLFESTGTVDRNRAEQYRRKREAEVYDQAALGHVSPATFADAIIAYKQHGGEERFLMPLLDHFQDTPLAAIGQAEADQCAAKLYPTAKPSTINRQCIGPLIAILRHAVEAELPGAVQRRIKMRKVSKPVIRPADDDHIAKLLPNCAPGLAALVRLMTYTGLRTGEALRVTESDCKDGWAVIDKTKNDDSGMVPLPDGWTYPAGGFGFTTTQGVGKALRAAHKAAGLPYRDGHELGRHAFAFRWLANGGDIKGLKEAGRWKKLAVVDEAYGFMERRDVHQKMRDLSKKGKNDEG